MYTDYSNYNARADGKYERIWMSTGKCVFCDLKDKYIIYEKDGVVLSMNLFPYKKGHLLIIPRRHFETYMDMNQKEWNAFYEVADVGLKLLKKTLNLEDVWVMFRSPKGYRAGKSVNHAHAHLLPYTLELININYEHIDESPIDTAVKLRSELKNVLK